MTTKPRKCQAKGGVASCVDPNCPEKRGQSADIEVPAFFTDRNTPKKPVPLGSWTEKDTVLYKTIHGSRLYGLAKADSDEDYYIVTPTRKTARAINAKQSIIGELDTTSVDFASFVRLCERGVPQALETMFSQKSKSDFFEEYRTSYYTSSGEVVDTYIRTIKSFSLSEKDPYKRKRHAMRLAVNLSEMLYTGRFNPTLSKKDAAFVTQQAHKEGPAYYKELNALQPIDLNWEKWLADQKEREAGKKA